VTTVQAVILGMMLAWVPSLQLIAGLLWRDHRKHSMKSRNLNNRIGLNKPFRGNRW
jgi:hypothetical protein